MMNRLTAVPMTRDKAFTFIREHHRHNKPPSGYRFAVGAAFGGILVGVATCGNPVARALDDGLTVEVTRVCVLDSAPKGTCSFFYSRLRRVWRELGGVKLVTYTLQSESGASLRGAGWTPKALLPAREAGSWTNRPGRTAQAVCAEPKIRWEVGV